MASFRYLVLYFQGQDMRNRSTQMMYSDVEILRKGSYEFWEFSDRYFSIYVKVYTVPLKEPCILSNREVRALKCVEHSI